MISCETSAMPLELPVVKKVGVLYEKQPELT